MDSLATAPLDVDALVEQLGHAKRTIATLREERERYTDALDHIMRTCHGSRTQTRRIRFIGLRAKCAIEGTDEWRVAQLPVNDPLVESLTELVRRIYPFVKSEFGSYVGGYTPLFDAMPDDENDTIDAPNREELIESLDERQIYDVVVSLRDWLLDARRKVPAINREEGMPHRGD